MCPFCIASVAIAVATKVTAGVGATALVAGAVRARTKPARGETHDPVQTPSEDRS